MNDAALGTGELHDQVRHLLHRHLFGITDVHRIILLGEHEAIDAFHQIADVSERTRLATVAEHGDVFAVERLVDERRYRASVVLPHARPERVENAHDFRVDTVIAVVGHGHGFGKAFG